MKTSIFTSPRRGMMGNRPLDADYMFQVTERARRMKAAAAIREQGREVDSRQQRLPGF